MVIYFQSYCQTEESDGHCIWRGVCFDDKKNCAYNGSAVALDDNGVDALKQWCSHLLPSNYVAGDVVSTCCDIEQVNLNFATFFNIF